MQHNHEPAPVTQSGPTSQEVGAEARKSLMDEYGSKTSARILSGVEFETVKERAGFSRCRSNRLFGAVGAGQDRGGPRTEGNG